ncbi:MAG TPA: hypothetical protein VHY22_13230 [Chthoniobacteraceae bacterium]|jgi:hypothetical protein|nr:hypothetical protein [Chthoniobacteraceae bacterium]
MKYPATAAALAALFLSRSIALAGDISWIFHPSAPGSDGPTAKYVSADVSGMELTFIPPLNWSVTPTRFFPPNKIEASLSVDAVKIDAPALWTPDRAKAMREYILTRGLPKDAQNVQVISESLNGINFGGRGSYEIAIGYSSYGQTFATDTIYIESGAVQLQFRLGCLRKDFDELHPYLRTAALSMHGF